MLERDLLGGQEKGFKAARWMMMGDDDDDEESGLRFQAP
jgi:hypothetical protein